MYKLRAFVLIFCLAVFGVRAGYADSLTESFNYGVGIVGSSWQIVPVASEGTITLTLNGDNTITATLTDYNGTINTVGFNFNNSCVNGVCPDINYSPNTTFNGWGSTGDQFGNQHLAFWCDDPLTGYPTSCGVSTVTWTISSDNVTFTSVYQLLGGTSSLSDFYLYDSNDGSTGNGDYLGQYGAGMPPYSPASPVPEPGSFLLLASGLAGTLGAIRRKLRA
ncbi:MAG TPA: PEP-CTERM sorting domain-containing protein [Terracidiphilus sp.]|nr:PEP-CTERM sorting domain-containing protein [Terracidiphilus sp.]